MYPFVEGDLYLNITTLGSFGNVRTAPTIHAANEILSKRNKRTNNKKIYIDIISIVTLLIMKLTHFFCRKYLMLPRIKMKTLQYFLSQINKRIHVDCPRL